MRGISEWEGGGGGGVMWLKIERGAGQKEEERRE